MACLQFAARYAPLYDRRFAIISGTAEPNADELEAGEAAEAEEREDDDEDDEEEQPSASVTELNESGEAASLKGVPEFWLVALKNHNIIGEQITERDEEALRHLTDIRLEYLDTKQAGFRLAFHFSANDFFEDTVLTKTYYYQEEVGYGGDFVYDRAVGCDIKWKEDKDLTKRVEIKKQRNKNTNRTRVVKKVVPTDSFFNFFKPPQPPSVDALEAGDVNEEELEDLDERLEVDYQVGEDLKERVIPRAIDYFTGKALDYEDDMEDFEDEDEDDFDEDSEDDVSVAVGPPFWQSPPQPFQHASPSLPLSGPENVSVLRSALPTCLFPTSLSLLFTVNADSHQMASASPNCPFQDDEDRRPAPAPASSQDPQECKQQ